MRKYIFIGMALLIILGVFLYTLNLSNENVLNNNENDIEEDKQGEIPNHDPVEHQDESEQNVRQQADEFDLERKVFFIENPKYERLDDQLIALLKVEFSEREKDWERYSFIIVNYIYGMIEGKLPYAWPYFELEDDDQSRTTIEENMVNYELDLEEQELISWSNDENLLILFINPLEDEFARIVSFQIDQERITLDEKFPLDEKINSFFDLPAIEGILKDKRFLKVYEQIIQTLDSPTHNVEVESLAESFIYYLYGILSGDNNLVTSFSHVLLSEGDRRDFEEQKTQLKKLSSFDFHLLDIHPSELEPSLSFILEFEKEEITEEWMFILYVDSLFIHISSIK